MQILNYLPAGWSTSRLEAFNDAVSACLAYMLYSQALQALNVNDPILLQIKTDVGDLIKNDLGPRLRSTP